MTDAGSPALNTTPCLSAKDRALAFAIIALEQDAVHFDAMASKALHWMRVVANSEIAEARWAGIKNHAFHRAVECRKALARIRDLVPDAGETGE